RYPPRRTRRAGGSPRHPGRLTGPLTPPRRAGGSRPVESARPGPVTLLTSVVCEYTLSSAARKSMGRRRRLRGEERRESILRAARRVFAEHGFSGTTTRALAEAAGVSEALLFQHFASKEALYAAMLATITQERDVSPFRELMALVPSTATLARIVHAFYSSLIEKQDERAEDRKATLTRLMFRSMTEDGEFARSYLRQVPSHLAGKIARCIQA